MTSRILSFTFALAVSSLLAGCQGGPPAGHGGSGSNPLTSSGENSTGTGRERPDPIAQQPRQGSVPDRRIIVARRNERKPFVMVNWSHARRQMQQRPQGPKYLALNGLVDSYYVLSDADFDDLVADLRNQNWDRLARPFDKETEGELITPNRVNDRTYLGIVVLEEGSRSSRVIGLRDGEDGPVNLLAMRAVFMHYRTKAKTEVPGHSYVDRLGGS